jgi:hypothetical protein
LDVVIRSLNADGDVPVVATEQWVEVNISHAVFTEVDLTRHRSVRE